MRTPSRLSVLAVLALLLGASPAVAQEQLGVIVFPNSGNDAAQPAFIRGVKLLHSFEFEDAATAFRQAQQADPGFALAYWGEAMTYNHGIWNEQDMAAARAVLARLGATPAERQAKAPTPREQAWLATAEILYGDGPKEKRDTLFSQALGELAAADTADNEALAFYALSLMSLSQAVRNIPAYMRAGALAQEVLRRNPDHPGGAHYVIHAFDDPVHAPIGLYAAQRYSVIAPGADHAQHMTTHIFLALGMWPEVVAQNAVASGPDSSKWRPGHYTSWMQYGLLQEGRYADARRLIELTRANMPAQPSAGSRYYLVLMRAQLVIDAEEWNDPVLKWTLDTTGLGTAPQAIDVFTTGFAAWKRGSTEAASSAVDHLARINLAGKADRYGRAETAVALEKELRGLVYLGAGRHEEGIGMLRDATTFEDGLAAEYGPPDIVKPTHELLGEVLLARGDNAEAQKEFTRALALAPGRSLSLLGLARAARAAGDSAVAAQAEVTLKQNWKDADPAGLAKYSGR
jgi:tetratricopeptide (TPR) repeat protein